MEPTPEIDGEHSEASLELFTVTLVGTLAVAVAILVGVSWKHLRAKAISPSDAPIQVE